MAVRVAGGVTHIGPKSYLNDETFVREMGETIDQLRESVDHSESLQELVGDGEGEGKLWDEWDFSFSAENNYDDWKDWDGSPGQAHYGDSFFDMFPDQIRAAKLAPFSAFVWLDKAQDAFAVFSDESEEALFERLWGAMGEDQRELSLENVGRSRWTEMAQRPKLKLVD